MSPRARPENSAHYFMETHLGEYRCIRKKLPMCKKDMKLVYIHVEMYNFKSGNPQ